MQLSFRRINPKMKLISSQPYKKWDDWIIEYLMVTAACMEYYEIAPKEQKYM